MKTPQVRPYWEALSKKRASLYAKKVFDIVVAFVLFIILLIPMIIIGIWIKMDSRGPAIYRQERVTAYGKRFRIHKFRTMAVDSDKNGNEITLKNDSRITKVGAKLRSLRIDELPQLLDILSGNMSFVGTRPEVVKYVEQYTAEYYATLLLPAGVTSEASIKFKDEHLLIEGADDVDRVYLEKVLPQKMYWNLNAVKNFSFFGDLSTMARTAFAVLEK